MGGSWHQFAYKRGPRVDAHPSPVGEILGVFLHANYVEALLDSKTNRPLNKAVAVALEILFGAAVAVVLGIPIATSKRLTWLGSIILLIVVIGFVFWQNLGVFFEFYIPAFLVVCHFAADTIRDWRREALLFRKTGEHGA
jgi:CHASE2 domain-containing sensor protein